MSDLQTAEPALTPHQLASIREQKEFTRLHKKPLQFGIEELLNYNGHHNEVKDFTVNNNNNHIVTWSQKELHFWCQKTGKRIGSRKVIDITGIHTQIITVAFSHRWRLYMVVTADFKMYFINELLYIVDCIDMSSIRLVNFVYFNDKDGTVITAGIDGVFVFKFNYQSKYQPILAVQIDQEGKHIKVSLENKTPLEKMCIWVKGLKVDEKNEIIISWNQGKLCFNHLNGSKAGKLIFCLKDLTGPEISITDVVINMENRYFHTGTSSGQILVWKYDTSKKQLHEFQGHFKAVSCLMPVKGEPDLLLSASLDSTIRIWSLDTFQQLYMLHLPTNGLSLMNLYFDGHRVLVAEGEKVTTCAIHANIKNYLAVDAEIENLIPIFDSLQAYQNHQVGSTFSLCSDNSGFIQQVGEQHKCTLYPPPSSQNIMEVKHSINLNRVIVMLANFSLCVYKVHRETALLEKILQPNELKDSEEKQIVLQQMSSMELIRTSNKEDIPPFDRYILNEKLHIAITRDILMEAPEGMQEFLALGMSKGSVFLIHVSKLNQLFCRFTIHREAVLHVRYLPNTNTFVSVCSEQNFCIWRIDKNEKNAKIIQCFKIKRNLKFIKVMEGGIDFFTEGPLPDRIWLGFESGDQEAFQFDGQMLWMIEAEKQKEHESPLTALDYNKALGLTITSDVSGIIRIWDQDKKFLREISYPHKIDSVCFFNAEGDILVSHEKRVSLMRYENYKTSSFKYVKETREPVTLVPVDDQLFDLLKSKDDQARGKKGAKVIDETEESEDEVVRATESPEQICTTIPQMVTKGNKRKQTGVVDIESAMAQVREAQAEMNQRIERNLENQAMLAKNQVQFDLKPYEKGALPKIKGRKLNKTKPLPGVSYLSTTGLYEDMRKNSKQFHLGHMTRRNITEHRISSNILNHNSPVVVNNYDSLNLGPQIHRGHRRGGTSFNIPGATIAGMTNFDLMLDRGTDPLKSGSIGFSSQKSTTNRRQDYNPTKVGPYPQFSQQGLMTQSSGLAQQILKPYGSTVENQLMVGKSITIATRNNDFENQTTYHNTSLQQASNDLMGPSIESTIMGGLKHGSLGGSPKPLMPKIGQRNVMYQKKGINPRNPFVLHTERSKQIDDYTSGQLRATKLKEKTPEKPRLDSSISAGPSGVKNIMLNSSPDQSMMYQNKFQHQNDKI